MDMRRNNTGAVLLSALGILFLLSMLGVAYLKYMSIEVDRTRFETQQLQASMAARAGVEAAISEMQNAMTTGAGPAKLVAEGFAMEVPIYGADPEKKAPLIAKTSAASQVKISDESGKLNLNHAPPRALEAILGVDGNTARTIRASVSLKDRESRPPTQAEILARMGGPAKVEAPAQPLWLSSVADLSARKLVPDSVVAGLDPKLVTVYSVSDNNRPAAFLNVNSAPPQVLAAILDVKPEAANLIAAKRPFTSLADMTAAAGKDASTFTFAPAPDAPNVLPPELSFESRCFRFHGETVLKDKKSKNMVEAVVVFGGSVPEITYWKEWVEKTETQAS